MNRTTTAAKDYEWAKEASCFNNLKNRNIAFKMIKEESDNL